MWNEDDILIAAAAFVVLNKKKRKRKKCWIRPYLQERAHGGGTSLMASLITDDQLTCGGHLKNFLQMLSSDFEILLSKIGPIITKEDTNWRRAISAKERLLVTLRFLVTGDSYHSMMYLFKLSKQAISLIIPEVCVALSQVLENEVKFPDNEREWRSIENEFYSRWNFSHCVGVIDGKHITIQAPHRSGSEFFNYKGFFSIVLFAVANANYQVLYYHVGAQGRISDGGVFGSTTFRKKLVDNELKLPASTPLPEREEAVPYVFLGDDAFPLSPNILKLYPGPQDKGSPRRIFNYRLSRARRVSENVFGILSVRFRVLRKPLLLEPEKAKIVVSACICLHNYLRGCADSKRYYTPRGTFDSEDKDTGEVIFGNWRRETAGETTFLPLKKTGRKSSLEAQNIRQEFTDFF